MNGGRGNAVVYNPQVFVARERGQLSVGLIACDNALVYKMNLCVARINQLHAEGGNRETTASESGEVKAAQLV